MLINPGTFAGICFGSLEKKMALCLVFRGPVQNLSWILYLSHKVINKSLNAAPFVHVTTSDFIAKSTRDRSVSQRPNRGQSSNECKVIYSVLGQSFHLFDFLSRSARFSDLPRDSYARFLAGRNQTRNAGEDCFTFWSRDRKISSGMGNGYFYSFEPATDRKLNFF